MFACNCDTDDGWCYKQVQDKDDGSWKCASTKGASRIMSEYCPDRRRRKRSVNSAILQAYSGLYSQLIERDALENFFSFDLNRDGLISLDEAMEIGGSNGTVDEFKKVDVNNDGFVHPSEFDLSLV